MKTANYRLNVSRYNLYMFVARSNYLFPIETQSLGKILLNKN